MLVVGTGAIGRCVASDLVPLGAEPVGMNRTGRPASGFEQVVSFDTWPQVCRTVDHPLWSEPRALITSHTVNPQPNRTALLAAHVEGNVRRWVIREPLLSVIDLERGY